MFRSRTIHGTILELVHTDHRGSIPNVKKQWNVLLRMCISIKTLLFAQSEHEERCGDKLRNNAHPVAVSASDFTLLLGKGGGKCFACNLQMNSHDQEMASKAETVMPNCASFGWSSSSSSSLSPVLCTYEREREREGEKIALVE